MRSRARKKAAARTSTGARRRWGDILPDGKEQYELKRHALLEAAAQLFNERGFYGASLGELAKRLNVTKPTVYYYVTSKEDLAVQILKLSHERAERLHEVAQTAGLSGLARMRAFVRVYVEFMTTPVGACTLQLATEPLARKYVTHISATLHPIDEWMQAILADGVRDGSMKSCDGRMVEFAILGALHWIPQWYKRSGSRSPEEIAEGLFRVFAGGIAARGGTGDDVESTDRPVGVRVPAGDRGV